MNNKAVNQQAAKSVRICRCWHLTAKFHLGTVSLCMWSICRCHSRLLPHVLLCLAQNWTGLLTGYGQATIKSVTVSYICDFIMGITYFGSPQQIYILEFTVLTKYSLPSGTLLGNRFFFFFHCSICILCKDFLVEHVSPAYGTVVWRQASSYYFAD
jgi:hypothetical protein